MSNESITVYDIAKEAGVSPATVSRVLTNSAKVSDEKKTRILEIIKKYDFEPNGFARSLSKQESKTIGMIVPDIRNPFYATLFVNCEVEASRYGYNMILCNTMNDLSNESVHLRSLLEKRVDAIIQLGGSVDEVNPSIPYIELINKIAKKIPIIIGGELEGADVYRIIPEQTHGMKTLLAYLNGLGHKEIALVGGCDSIIPTLQKRLHYKSYLEEHNMLFRKELVIDSNYSLDGGYEAAQQLIVLGKLPSAIIAVNEAIAMGVMKAMGEKGLRIPDDLSVIGYDDTFYAEMTVPQLTCISYNLNQYAEKIMETVIHVISKNENEKYKYIPTNLVVRGSSKNITL